MHRNDNTFLFFGWQKYDENTIYSDIVLTVKEYDCFKQISQNGANASDVLKL